MAVTSSGAVSLIAIATEFGDTAPHGLKEFYRGGGKVPEASANNTVPTTGAIGMRNFYGAVNRIAATVTIAANTTNYTLNTAAVPGYIAGITDVTFVVNSGVYLYSTNTATPALTVSAFNAADTVTIVNNGYIIGMGGQGGYIDAGEGVQSGGPAISLGISLSITNNSYIAGGGGGGKNGASNGVSGGGGGGAGGGKGGNALFPAYYPLTGGAGGGPGLSGSNGIGGYDELGDYYIGGGGGGRILPGVGGGNGGGAGGGAGGGGYGGSGGSANAAGTNGSYSGGGGGWGASGGGSNVQVGAGGAGGKCVNLNGYTVTWLATGTRYGAIS